MKSILSAVVGATLALSAIEANAQATHGERQVTLTIETDTLASALDKWAQQSGFQIFVQDWEAAKNLPARSLKGTFAAQDALEQLLSGTPLTYVWISDKAVSIRKKMPQTVPTALQRTSLEGQQTIAVAKFSGDDAGSGSSRYSESGAMDGGTSGGDRSARVERVEEVIVTGTYIRGTAPVGSPLKAYGRQQIEQSGATTIDQFARKMTENFSNVDQVAGLFATSSRFGTSGSGGDIYGGSSFNLRGIGPSATLTLLDGSRLAPGGSDGGLTDTSLIPLSAIERIEVLTDGASAIYGADAVAGVVNMITRRDFEGAETTLNVADSTEGGGTQYSASQAFGAAWDGGNALFNYQYTKQEDLEAADRSFIPDVSGVVFLIPESDTHSVFLSGSQFLGSRTRLFGHALYSERNGTIMNREERTGISLDSDFGFRTKQSAVVLGIEQDIADDWSIKLVGNYARSPQESDSTLASDFGFSNVQAANAKPEVYGADLLLNGALWQLPAGPLKAAFGASYRREEFTSSTVSESFFGGMSLGTAITDMPDLQRRVKSAFGELRIPIVGRPDGSPILELSAASRYDDYDDFGSDDTYKFGADWSPFEGLHIRGTYGTSFRAPLLRDLGSPVVVDAGPFPDPDFSPTGVSNVLSIGGGNPDLRPEKSTSYTAGLDVVPEAVRDLRLSATYFDIDFTGRIAAPNIQGIFTTNPTAQPFITRNPPLDQVEDLFAMPGLRNPALLTPEDIDLIYIGNQVTNLSSTHQSGLDFDVSYAPRTDSSAWLFGLSATYLLKNETRTLPGQPEIDYRNTFSQPPKLKGRASFGWTGGSFSASLFVNHVNSYRNGLGANADNPGGSPLEIGSWTTADVFLSYRTEGSDTGRLLGGITLSLSINNVTDEDPPRVVIPDSALLPGQFYLPFDAANASPMGRYVSVQLRKDW